MARVAVIGSGPSGLSVLRAFAMARDKKQAIPEVVCFEKQADWGGQWRYTWRVGTDENGEPVQSSMYRFLWSNGPKEGLEFADYSFEEHFGKAIPSYPPREPLANYIMGRAAKSSVRDWVRFETPVRWIEAKPGGGFVVTSHDLKKNRVTAEDFDYVVVATGHFSVPNYPKFDGIETFPGRVLHSHDFRSAEEFAGQDLLIVGASYSAEDIGLQCKKYGAKSVTFSYRTAAMGFDWPKGMDERELLTKVEGRTVRFMDKSKKDFDAIVLCTGYLHSFPFLPSDLKLVTRNRLFAPGLYKGVVWVENPALFYIGMQDQWYTFTMFDVEAWYARDIMLGRIKLPSKADMTIEMAEWAKREEALEDAYQMIDFQADYVRELANQSDYPKWDIDSSVAAFKQWKKDKGKSIISYRDKAFKSPVTGTMSPVHHTAWWSAMDDSEATYLATK
ncbi:MAG: NAD(P)-binding domain-containing protein [Kiloniellales bacterium]